MSEPPVTEGLSHTCVGSDFSSLLDSYRELEGRHSW